MPEAGFALHPRLAADCHALGELPLCRVLLMDDARYPWLILVPRRPDITEIYQLDAADRAALWAETNAAGEALMRLTGADKLNIAALGNQVPQLHMHLIARRRDDDAWPGPVWGVGEPQPYDDADRAEITARLVGGLALS